MTYRYFLFVAYSGVFVAFFVYMWMMNSRQKKLERKLDELKEQLKAK
jgi:CcmD family protein